MSSRALEESPINFPRGLQKTERGKRICCKTHSKDRFQLCKDKRYWMCPEKYPLLKKPNIFLKSRWPIQGCNLSLSSHSTLLCSLRSPDEHHSLQHTVSGRKYGIVSFSGKRGKLANSLSKEENCNSLANWGCCCWSKGGQATKPQQSPVPAAVFSFPVFFSSFISLGFFAFDTNMRNLCTVHILLKIKPAQ